MARPGRAGPKRAHYTRLRQQEKGKPGGAGLPPSPLNPGLQADSGA
jgi:hypothetical protein